jgi:hypothetical protein
MDKRVSHLRYYRGPMLKFISEKLYGRSDRETLQSLHEAFKEYMDIDTLRGKSYEELRKYTAAIRTYMVTEHAVLVPLPGEKDLGDLDEMEMKEFLKATIEWKDYESTSSMRRESDGMQGIPG